MIAVCNHDSYFVQKKDAFGVMGLILEQTITAALRMLAYGASADQVDEIARMGTSPILESLMRFCGAIKSIYTTEYLRRHTEMDLQRLLKKGEMRDFLGMIGSINLPCLRSAKEKDFASCQEGCRKDVERCFGILQARWAIVKGAARMFDLESLRSIMMTCTILHNMIVEDEYNYDAVDEYEPDTMNNSRTQIYCAHDATEEPVQHEPLEKDERYNEKLIQRYTVLQRPYMHNAWQIDLIEH
ncbi:uncharacterized protein [Pyrus communis]|uniref:uncharacterized protein n=1 Tax=Pyrus communis TaxID=23211 RepID=UPI0035BFF565